MRRWTFVVIFLLHTPVATARVHAECGAMMSLDEQFAMSQAVFVGRAIGQEIVSNQSRPGSRETQTTFEVEEIWKGTADSARRVRTCGWTDGTLMTTCSEGFTFIVGSRYVVFATGDPLETSQCFATALVDRAEKTLLWLSEKPRKRLANPALELAALANRPAGDDRAPQLRARNVRHKRGTHTAVS